MAGLKMDSAGQNKMKTLEESVLHLQRIHGIVEQYGMAVKANQPTNVFMMNLKRQLPSLAANMKNQFGMISDLVTAITLGMTRGGSEQMRLRGMREGVAQVKQAIEIAITQTKDKHMVRDHGHAPAAKTDAT